MNAPELDTLEAIEAAAARANGAPPIAAGIAAPQSPAPLPPRTAEAYELAVAQIHTLLQTAAGALHAAHMAADLLAALVRDALASAEQAGATSAAQSIADATRAASASVASHGEPAAPASLGTFDD